MSIGTILLIVLTGLSGANLAITGAMLLTGSITLAQLDTAGSAAIAWRMFSPVVAVRLSVAPSGSMMAEIR